MERQTITVDIAPGNNQIQRLKSSQGDIGRPLGVYITQNGVALDCSAYTADLYILKPDGNYFTATVTVDATEHNLITWETAKQETPVAGDCAAQIRILSNGDDVGTARFVEYVEASPGFVGESSESVVESLMEYVRQAAASAETASGAASSATGSASAASGSASSAAQSASAAAGSASTAHTDAETASQAAQTAQDVAASIPEDYSTLSEDVTSLKSALNQTLPVLYGDFGVTLTPEVEYSSNKVPNHDGTFFTDTGATQKWFGSGYIEIPVGVKKIAFCGINYNATTVTPIAFYNSSKEFISCDNSSTVYAPVEGVIDVPNNARYFYQSKYYASGDSHNSNNYTIYQYGQEVSIAMLKRLGCPANYYGEEAFTDTKVYKTDGTIYTATGWYSTDFLPCDGAATVNYRVYTYPGIAPVSFFDGNKSIIGYVPPGSLGQPITGRYNVPNGCKFVRAVKAGDIDPFIQVNASGLFSAEDQLPLTYNGTICCVGDSLTKGVDVGSHIIREGYPYFLSLYLNCFTVNYGAPGVSAKGWWNNNNQTMTFDSNMDVVLIMFGTNGGLAINTLATDVEPYNDWHDYADTECGCYCKLIESIMDQTQNHAQIILMTPPYSTYSSGQTEIVIATEPVIRAIAKRYCLPVIDVLNESGMNAFNGSVFRPHDGCHFNAKGYHKLATFIGSKVKSMISTFDLNENYYDETALS